MEVYLDGQLLTLVIPDSLRLYLSDYDSIPQLELELYHDERIKEMNDLSDIKEKHVVEIKGQTPNEIGKANILCTGDFEFTING